MKLKDVMVIEPVSANALEGMVAGMLMHHEMTNASVICCCPCLAYLILYQLEVPSHAVPTHFPYTAHSHSYECYTFDSSIRAQLLQQIVQC